MTDLLDRPFVVVANVEDATETADRVRHIIKPESTIVVGHVIQKAGGAPDKASLEGRQEQADGIFEAFENRATLDGYTVERSLLYGTNVGETIIDAADDLEATAIVFSSRGGGGWLDALSGGVRSTLVTDSRLPVVVVPDEPNTGTRS